MTALLLALVIVAALALRIGLAVLAIAMAYGNITDIASVGLNFWNVAWLVVAAFLLAMAVHPGSDR